MHAAPFAHVVEMVAVLAREAASAAAGGAAIQPVWEISTVTARLARFGLMKDSSCEVCSPPVPDTEQDARIRVEPTPVDRPCHPHRHRCGHRKTVHSRCTAVVAGPADHLC
jgi:ribosomal protein S12 methylthiotransferase accessory factor